VSLDLMHVKSLLFLDKTKKSQKLRTYFIFHDYFAYQIIAFLEGSVFKWVRIENYVVENFIKSLKNYLDLLVIVSVNILQMNAQLID
jgi:hypothetical protein